MLFYLIAGTCGSLCNQTENCTQICPESYYGPDCSVQCTPVDSCEGHYTCDPNNGTKICRQNWSGTNCLTYQFLGLLNTQCPNAVLLTGCSNGGTCFNGTCCCPPGFGGTICDVVISNPCAVNPCLNGGQCNVDGNSYKCICPTGRFLLLMLC